MMEWTDIACIVFTCVTMNHLGLIEAIERAVGFPLWIVNCPKCSTFWFVLAYGFLRVGLTDVPSVLAVSFLAGYSAIWVEMLEGIVDTIYLKLYERIFNEKDDESAAEPSRGCSAGSVSQLSESGKNEKKK